MTIKVIDITKDVAKLLQNAGYGSDRNTEKEISKAGIFDLMDALTSRNNCKFSVEQARTELEKRGL